jgi:hypothetical protein
VPENHARADPMTARSFLRWVAPLAFALPLRPGPLQQDSCVSCHLGEAILEKDRAHARAGIRCTDCHGGDSTKSEMNEAKALGTGYRGRLERATWPTLCGDCHADVRRMNPFGIPTDQLAQYRTSKHGEAFFKKGDEKVATCVDCHGSHGVLDARNPESPVHPTNVPATCGRCHSSASRMEDYGLDATAETHWRESVHAKLLLEKKDLSAPHCATCHGNHGAVPPGFKDVGAVCGKCHIRQKEFFDKSPHAKLVEKGDFNTCVVCHSNHKVLPASDRIFDSACRVCHAAGDKALAARDRIAGTIRATSRRFDLAKEDLAQARRTGIGTEDEQVLLENAKTSLLELEPAQHALDPALLDPIAAEATASLDRLERTLSSARALERTKRLAILPAALFLALMSLGFWLRFRRIHRSSEVTR